MSLRAAAGSGAAVWHFGEPGYQACAWRAPADPHRSQPGAAPQSYLMDLRSGSPVSLMETVTWA